MRTVPRPLRRLLHGGAAALLGVVTVASGAPPASAAGPTISGAGSTFAQIAIEEWRSDVARLQDLQVNYQGGGSTSGRNFFAAGSVDFASSDVSYRFSDPTEVLPGFRFEYMPLVAGGTAIMYNLRDAAGRRITDLRLSPDTTMRILAKFALPAADAINNWNDPRIVAENPHLAGRLPAKNISTVVRADGSGTTSVFTNWLVATGASYWNQMIDKARREEPSFTLCQRDRPCDRWPSANANRFVNGSDSLAAQVAGSDGSLGYAETSWATTQDLPVVRLRNPAGNYVLPTARNVAIALTQARSNPDGTYNLAAVFPYTHPESYPISSYNYLIVPVDPSRISPDKGEVLTRFALYSVTEGQAKAAGMEYSPMPTNLIQQAFGVLRKIPGAPAIPSDAEADRWGRYYEQLGVDEAVKDFDPSAAPQPGAGTTVTTQSGAQAAAQSGAQAAAQSGAQAAAQSGAQAGAQSSGSGTAAGAAAAGAARPGAAAAPGPGAPGAGGTGQGPGSSLATGAGPDPGAQLAAGVPSIADPEVASAVRSQIGADAVSGAADRTTQYLAGALLLAVLFGPPLLAPLASRAGAVLRRRRPAGRGA